MVDPQDIVDIDGFRREPSPKPRPEPKRKFLSIWFRCCHTYGRLYRNRDATAYVGRCPRCGASVQARIGPGGSDRRIFETS